MSASASETGAAGPLSSNPEPQPYPPTPKVLSSNPILQPQPYPPTPKAEYLAGHDEGGAREQEFARQRHRRRGRPCTEGDEG